MKIKGKKPKKSLYFIHEDRKKTRSHLFKCNIFGHNSLLGFKNFASRTNHFLFCSKLLQIIYSSRISFTLNLAFLKPPKKMANALKLMARAVWTNQFTTFVKRTKHLSILEHFHLAQIEIIWKSRLYYTERTLIQLKIVFAYERKTVLSIKMIHDRS